MRRIGLLGGTFNPIHNGHIRHAIEVREALGLEKVMLIPCSSPPHKKKNGLLSFELRVDLMKAALKNISFLEICTLEAELPQPSYTWQTLVSWRLNNPEDEAFFMMGAESFAALDTWFRGLELPQLAHIVMVPRAGSDGKLFYDSIRSFWPGSIPPGCIPPIKKTTVALHGHGECTYLPLPRLDISSTFIRKRWLEGKNLAGLLQDQEITVLQQNSDVVSSCWQQNTDNAADSLY